jgi:hypothetical protein
VYSRCILLSLAIVSGACSAPPSTQSLSTAARTAAIDARVPTLRLDTATVLSLSTEGATLEAAYEGAKLRRLRASYLGETGRAIDTFYFDSAAFCAVLQSFRYDAPLSGRIADSTSDTTDYTLAVVPRARVDSLNAVAQRLLHLLQHPDG